MKQERALDTVVIGAGQAGLAVSGLLAKHQVPHLVLERGQIGESWRSQRWDSFRVNTPNRFNMLPFDTHAGTEPNGFCSRDELVDYFERYSRRHGLPIREGITVTAVRRSQDGFEVETSEAVHRCSNVVMCTGDQNLPRTPAFASELPADVRQLHAADYRSPEELPEGAVLVAGSAQSGVQIAEELAEAGRRVYLCTSKVGRGPRRYRGRDIFEWMQLAGMTEHRPDDLQDPADINAPQPQISGTRGGHSVSLQELARMGVQLLGRLEAVEGRVLRIGADLAANVAAGDAGAAKLRAAVDALIANAALGSPPARPDPTDEPFEGLEAMTRVRELDLDRAGIRSVVWATGFGPDFSYLDPSLLDERGYPRNHDGVCAVPGLYCLGLKWQRRRVSGLLIGVGGDAGYVAEAILDRRVQREAPQPSA